MRNENRCGRGREFPATNHAAERRHHDGDGPRNGRRRGGRALDYGQLRLLILSIIARQPAHGYELMKAVEERFGGTYSPSPGVLYPTLAWLDDVGYASVEATGGNRRSYRITPEGEAFLAANHAMLAGLNARACGGGPRPRGAPPVVVEAMDALKAALRCRIVRPQTDAGEPERIAEILHEAARRISEATDETRETQPHPTDEQNT